MPELIAVAGFLGAWLLVAGPVYQAAVELDSEPVDREGFEVVDSGIPERRRISPWWWLLPPVALVRQRRVSRRRRELLMRALTLEQIAQMVSFGSKATGWLLVASGGFLIAVKETWELVERIEWSVAAFWALDAAALLVSLLYAVVRLHHDHRMLDLKRAMTPSPSPSAASSSSVQR